MFLNHFYIKSYSSSSRQHGMHRQALLSLLYRKKWSSYTSWYCWLCNKFIVNFPIQLHFHLTAGWLVGRSVGLLPFLSPRCAGALLFTWTCAYAGPDTYRPASGMTKEVGFHLLMRSSSVSHPFHCSLNH